MTARTTRRTFTLGAVATTAGALALALIPATAANAVGPTTPVFSYIAHSDADLDRVLYSNAATGNPDSPASPTAVSLTPLTGMQIYSYDASNDGNSWVSCMASGTPGDDTYDRTYALVLTHREGANTASKIISNFCESNPVMSADGSTVWWYTEDRIAKFAATYDPGTAAISGTTSVVSSGQFVTAKDNSNGAPAEWVSGLAVSPNGVNAAVMLHDKAGYGTRARVRASALSTAAQKPAYFQTTYTGSTTTTASHSYLPQADTFVFSDNDTLLFNLIDLKVAAPRPFLAVSAKLPAAATNTSVITVVPALGGTYGVRPYLDPASPSGTLPTWYAWHDVPVGDPAVLVTQLGVTSDLTVAPATWTPRTDGLTTFSYIPTAVALPALRDVSQKAAPHASFTLASSLVTYGKRPVFATAYNLYDINPLGGAYNGLLAAESDKGKLEKSIDGGTTWIQLPDTSGANAFLSGSTWVSGTGPIVTSNTYFRWTFLGSPFTEAAPAITRYVKVLPIVTVKILSSGSYKTVYGKATRKYGSAILQRYFPTLGWRNVLTRTMSATGDFNFGKRILAKANYRVLTLADTKWAAGVKAFTI